MYVVKERAREDRSKFTRSSFLDHTLCMVECSGVSLWLIFTRLVVVVSEAGVESRLLD